MAGRKRTNRVPASSANTLLALSDIQNAHKKKVSMAFIEELGGDVPYRPVGADVALAFMEEGISRKEQINAMARYISETLCTPEGEDFISFEQALKLPIETIENITTGIAVSRKSKRGASGNV